MRSGRRPDAARGAGPSPRIGELGEFGVIARLREWIGRGADQGSAGVLRVGPGDDAAVLRMEAGAGAANADPDSGRDAGDARPHGRCDLVWTCDIQIDGRHFLSDWLDPEEIGSRAAEINLSDMAAMGAEPVAALISLGLPPEMPLAALERIYGGLAESLRRWGARIAGGNVTGADRLLIDISLLGRVERDRALLRSAARPGDVIFVTGRPGRSAAALAAHRAGATIPEDLRARLRPAYAAPRARVEVGRHLIANEIPAAAIDLSDGLAGDLRHIAEESRAGVLLARALLPVDADLADLARALGRDPLDWVLGPSDDYELICAVPRAAVDAMFAIPAALGIPISAVGEIAGPPGRVALIDDRGVERELGPGWDHFAPREEER